MTESNPFFAEVSSTISPARFKSFVDHVQNQIEVCAVVRAFRRGHHLVVFFDTNDSSLLDREL